MGPADGDLHEHGGDGVPRRAASEDLCDALDGAGGDLTVSGDAMRWSPEQADAPAGRPSPWPPSWPPSLPGLDVAAGIGSALGLDAAAVRRLVSGAVTRLATVAGEAVAELRQRAADAFPGDDHR